MRFNAELFESLNGLEAASYAVGLMEGGIAEVDFLPYFEIKAATMDATHLELAIGMLGKINSVAADRKVAEYLEHSDFNVRFVATKSIARLAFVDEIIMRRIVESLALHVGDFGCLANELTPALDRPANEKARRVVLEYRSKQTK